MCRMQHLVFVASLALAAAAFAGSRAATPTGTITFTGLIVDPNTPFVPGSIVTVHGTVVARSGQCAETRVMRRNPQPAAFLWLCTHAQNARPQLAVGSAVVARARITGIKATDAGQAPYSDSFILLRTD